MFVGLQVIYVTGVVRVKLRGIEHVPEPRKNPLHGRATSAGIVGPREYVLGTE